MSSYILTTTESEKRALDLQVAAMMYATNTQFMWVEHVQVIKLINMLRPGYTLPSRTAVGSTLLDQVHAEAYAICKEKVKGKPVFMEIDGWSNVLNEPVVCSSITTNDGETFLTSTIDTKTKRHTGGNDKHWITFQR